MKKDKNKTRWEKMYKDSQDCFGKLYSEKEAECRKCFDREACKDYMKKSKEVETSATVKPSVSETITFETPEGIEAEVIGKEETMKVGGKDIKVVNAEAVKVKGQKKEEKDKKEKSGTKTDKVVKANATNDFFDIINAFKGKSKRMAELVSEGTYTREDVLKILNIEFPGGAKGANKATFDIFCSDRFLQKVRKLSIKVVKSEDGILRFERI